MATCYVIMGVSACGKTTLGRALAGELGVPFFDGDDFHPPASIAKMSAGQPLNDQRSMSVPSSWEPAFLL